MKSQCHWCDALVPLMARTCPECGAVNPARRTALVAIAIAAVLIPAIAIAIYAATRWDQPLITAADRPAEQALPSQPVTASDGNFDWLAAAMKSCDEKAAREPNMLHALVIPLIFDSKDIEQWRKLALNRIGNAMVLPGDEMLNGLRRKTLSIAPEEYTFSVRDGKTQTVRKWARSTGVKWFSAPGVEDFTSFTMQYRPRDKGRDDNWGNPIVHQKGNCYWVNATFEE
ncbi:MAG: hypothetical protein ABWY14_08425 [Tardiphaga sp.]|jgi:hypothetical protein